MSNIFITGASGGFGKLTAQALRKNGHQVTASMRDIEGKNKAAANDLRELGCYVVEMDVTSDESAHKAISAAIKNAGGIDVVINNAGQGVLGLQEAFTTEDWKRVFDVNVFGVQRVIRSVLPHFKERKKGLIVNVSSLLGRVSIPFYGPYQASKWALEAMSESYRVELSQLGIEVCIVEPGGFPTTFSSHLLRPSDSTRNEPYGEMGHMPELSLQNFEKAMAANPAQDPNNVATAIAALVDEPHGKRKFRTTVDKMGLGDQVALYNEYSENLIAGIYKAMGMGHLLQVKQNSED